MSNGKRAGLYLRYKAMVERTAVISEMNSGSVISKMNSGSVISEMNSGETPHPPVCVNVTALPIYLIICSLDNAISETPP